MERIDNTPLRPTFSVRVAMPRDDAIEAIRAALVRRKEMSGRWRGKGRWAELYVPFSDRRIWSPYLSIRVDDEQKGCSLFGRFSPSPAVWTFFMFLYGGVVFLVAFGAIFGYVQWASGTAAWAFWSVWVGVPILGLLHLTSWIGKRLGHGQMKSLKNEIDEVLLDLGKALE